MHAKKQKIKTKNPSQGSTCQKKKKKKLTKIKKTDNCTQEQVFQLAKLNFITE